MRIIKATELGAGVKSSVICPTSSRYSGLTLSNSKHNRILRICAALMAGLYMALSTFGSLTHLHEVSSPRLTSAATAHGTHHSSMFGQNKASGKCAYCDWLASNLSPAIALQLPPSFETENTPATSWLPTAYASRLERSSSRAPPQFEPI